MSQRERAERLQRLQDERLQAEMDELMQLTSISQQEQDEALRLQAELDGLLRCSSIPLQEQDELFRIQAELGELLALKVKRPLQDERLLQKQAERDKLIFGLLQSWKNRLLQLSTQLERNGSQKEAHGNTDDHGQPPTPSFADGMSPPTPSFDDRAFATQGHSVADRVLEEQRMHVSAALPQFGESSSHAADHGPPPTPSFADGTFTTNKHTPADRVVEEPAEIAVDAYPGLPHEGPPAEKTDSIVHGAHPAGAMQQFYSLVQPLWSHMQTEHKSQDSWWALTGLTSQSYSCCSSPTADNTDIVVGCIHPQAGDNPLAHVPDPIQPEIIRYHSLLDGVGERS